MNLLIFLSGVGVACAALYFVRKLSRYFDDRDAKIVELTERVAKLEQANALRLPWHALDIALDAVSMLDRIESDEEVEVVRAQFKKQQTTEAKKLLMDFMHTGTKGPDYGRKAE